jgi:hypothetical protein
MFLGLAYDLRKAYEASRKVLKPPEHSPEGDALDISAKKNRQSLAVSKLT